MSIKKFGENDLLINTMKTHPKSEFFIFDSVVYYNGQNQQSGAFSHNVRNVGPGHISLYEYNIDKAEGTNEFIYPYVVKSSDRLMFRTSFTASAGESDSFWNSVAEGDKIYGNYPMSASISRQFWTGSSAGYNANGRCGKYAGQCKPLYNEDAVAAGLSGLITREEFRDGASIYCATGAPWHRHYYAIRNKLDFYRTRSEHYAISSSFFLSGAEGTRTGWNKDLQEINAIMIPSIFFGSKIKPGTLSLKMYMTGTLIGELQDSKQNGELIQVSGALDHGWKLGSGSVAGVALYEEGVLLLTGNWNLAPTIATQRIHATSRDYPKWKYFGAGCEDQVSTAVDSTHGHTFLSMSYDLSFKGTTETQILTMYTHAKKGQANHSNNPTFIQYGQDKLAITSSNIYQENAQRSIKNTVSSSFAGHSASFERQVYISKIGIYDKKKRLIGVASLANPILKKEDQDYTFKLKLDI